MDIKDMLSPIQDLFADSWQLFKKGLLNVFLFYLLSFAILILLIVFGAILLGVTGLGAALFTGSPNTLLQGPGVILFVILAIVFILALMAIGFILQIGPILILTNPEHSVDFRALLQKSLHIAWPLFLTQLLVSLIVFGGIVLLIIPGIIISIFLSFAMYEVILGNKCCLEALRESVKTVSKNFWGIVLRLLIFFAISTLAAIALKDLSGLYFVFNIFWGWFGIAYSLTLYKQAKKEAREKPGSLKWMLIASAVGWVVFIAAFSFIVSQSENIISSLTERSNAPIPAPVLEEIENSTPSSQLQ